LFHVAEFDQASIRSAAASVASHVHFTKQGTPNFITEAHYILATISLKFRARITKFQGDVPEALQHGISLVRLEICMDHVKLAAAERISPMYLDGLYMYAYYTLQ
jgi:hypothetical protein